MRQEKRGKIIKIKAFEFQRFTNTEPFVHFNVYEVCVPI